ncbi:GvpL/GvpF family gas vesicle protein [Herbidospora sp. NBRC 101105]|uniref:GvpL/GvpF family gas vesicle protein n=1 Tax=Herbidospora sp. NBRC 101105 TaxID=3032195 RepID=UPI0024A2086F|nr:GvpL/GvpF family gas vesicle protein [Herbidospora sp. NBRC 101105]GLX95027.1 gas vesicle protein [Herbidospora sp. NBRC 101105]
MTDTGTYLYAVTEETPASGLEGLHGVADTEVRTIPCEGLVAYVSTVSLDEFGAEPLRRSMEDLDWLSETAGAHHHVVEEVADRAPVAPVRLVTVYRGDEQVKDLLRARHDDFVDVLSSVAGRREWGVKAYVDLSAPGPAQTAPSLGGPGTAYLKRRQAGLRSREEAWRQAAMEAERLHETLSSIAVASHRHRAQDPELSGRKEAMLLNGAYLVERSRDDEFLKTVDDLRDRGVEIELTGPWAPYSFTDLEVRGDG